MPLFPSDITKLVDAAVTLAAAAKKAADTYAENSKQPTIVVNVNTEPSMLNANDVARAVSKAVKLQDR